MSETKTVIVTEGVTVYTGMGLHPFKGGETVELPADVADELVAHGTVSHDVPDAPDPAKSGLPGRGLPGRDDPKPDIDGPDQAKPKSSGFVGRR